MLCLDTRVRKQRRDDVGTHGCARCDVEGNV